MTPTVTHSEQGAFHWQTGKRAVSTETSLSGPAT